MFLFEQHLEILTSERIYMNEENGDTVFIDNVPIIYEELLI
jgi:hypothetical protein